MMCGIYKLASLIYKFLLNHDAGKNGIFAEYITYTNPSTCFYLSSLFNVCLMHVRIPKQSMKAIVMLKCKNRNSDISDTVN